MSAIIPCKQPLMKYGFVDMNNNQWPDIWVDSYNYLTNEINKSANIRIDSDSLMNKEREFFLDQRHKQYVQFMQILNED